MLFKRGRNLVPTPGIMYRRAVFDYWHFDASLPIYFGDFIVLMRIAKANDVGLIADELIHVRMHSENAQLIPLNRAIAFRTDLMLSYCAEYIARWPNDREFAGNIEKQIDRVNHVGLLLGWISALDEADAEACLFQLEENLNRFGLASVLRLSDRLGLTLQRRRMFLPFMRKFGDTMGV